MNKLLLIFLLFSYQSIFADSFDWTSSNLTIQTGNIANLKNISKMKYKIGYEPSGFGHLSSGVEINWTDSTGETKSQTVFEAMVENPPQKITSNLDNSTISIQFENPCEPEPEDIIQVDLVYEYSFEKKIFERQH